MEIDDNGDSKQSTNGNDVEMMNYGTEDTLDVSGEVIYIFIYIFS